MLNPGAVRLTPPDQTVVTVGWGVVVSCLAGLL